MGARTLRKHLPEREKAMMSLSCFCFSWENIPGQSWRLWISGRWVRSERPFKTMRVWGSSHIRYWDSAVHFFFRSCEHGRRWGELFASPKSLCSLGVDYHSGGVRVGLASLLTLLGPVLLLLWSSLERPRWAFSAAALQPRCLMLLFHWLLMRLSSYPTLRERCRWEAAPTNCICFSVITLQSIKEDQFPY